MSLELDPGLGCCPQDLDNIERIPPTPKRDHAYLRVEGKECWGAVILTGTVGGQVSSWAVDRWAVGCGRRPTAYCLSAYCLNSMPSPTTGILSDRRRWRPCAARNGAAGWSPSRSGRPWR